MMQGSCAVQFLRVVYGLFVINGRGDIFRGGLEIVRNRPDTLTFEAYFEGMSKIEMSDVH